MMLVRTFLAPSKIEGLGVFAGEFIPAGRLIWRLDPKFDIFIHRSEITSLPDHLKDYIARYAYPHLEMPDVLILDSDDGKFMNHSDAPNTDFRDFSRGYARHDIRPCEELTCSYFEFDPTFRGFAGGAGEVRTARRQQRRRPVPAAT